MSAAGTGLPRANGLRSLRGVVLVNSVAIAVSLALFVVALLEVQDSRRDSVRITCEQQNLRHDRTIAALDELIAQIRDPARRLRALEGRSNTVALIDALAPRFDCAKRAELLVK